MGIMSVSTEDLKAVENYFKEWRDVVREAVDSGLPAQQWKRLLPSAPIAAVQAAALHHPNPRRRRDCLTVLDHEASDASVNTFREALADPVPRVRQVALHGLACERCRESELCVADLVPTLIGTLKGDANAKVRHAALGILVALSDRDDRVGEAIRDATGHDADPLVRQAALAASQGHCRGMGSRKAMRRRARRTAAAI
jgi:hypothetical protein